MMTKFRNWLPLAITITILCALAYIIGQQSLRMAANDPQVEISEELASAVSAVEDPAQFDSPQKLDIAKSLSAFWVVYDEQGKPLAGNSQINGKLPELPKGALDAAKTKGENRVTWQPQAGLRDAVVIRPYSGKAKGFVAAGRSLREMEKRDKNLRILSVLAWIIAMAGSLIATLFLPKLPIHHSSAEHAEHHHD